MIKRVDVRNIIVGILFILVLMVAFPRATYAALKINAPRIKGLEQVDLPTDARIDIKRISWRKIKRVSGYQVQIEKKLKNVNEWYEYDYYTKDRYISIEVDNAAEIKIKVRAYKNLGGKYFFGKWSKELVI